MTEQGIISDKTLYEFCCGKEILDIVGLFSSAVYLQAHSGRVIVLHDQRYGSLPFGVALEDVPVVNRNAELRLEGAVQLTRQKLIIPQLCLEIRLSFQPAEKPSTSLSSEGLAELCLMISEELRHSGKSELLFYAEAWPDLPERSSFSDPFASAAHPGMTVLRDALQTGNRELVDAALKKLLGLGRGLTPSLDDYLFAFLYTFRILEITQKESLLATLSDCILQNADHRTNLFSAAYLRAAVSEGRFSLLDNCLYTQDTTSRAAAIARLSAVGGSSGNDMLAGMLFSLRFTR